MANKKISELPLAIDTSSSDTFMVIQDGSNKRITLETLLGNLNTNIIINSKLENRNLCINGLNKSNLLYTDAATNHVGILTNTPSAALQVVGNIKIGEEKDIVRTIIAVSVGTNGLDGYKEVTVTTSSSEENITGIFNVDDIVYVTGIDGTNTNTSDTVLITALNGYKSIIQASSFSFKYKIPNAVSLNGSGPSFILLNPTQTSADASKKLYKPGVLVSSVEQITHNSTLGTKFIDANYETTGLNIIGECSFVLIDEGTTGQEKKIFFKTADSSGDRATFTNVNGLGFNTIVFNEVGDSISLKYENDTWVCLSLYGATLSVL